MAIIAIYLLMEKICKFKADNKYVNFLFNFALENCLALENVTSDEVLFKGNVYDFSVDYDAIDLSEISNIHKYLMVKNDTK